MRRPSFAIILASAATLASPASADDGSPSDEPDPGPNVERVRAWLDGPVAHLAVRYRVRVSPDEAYRQPLLLPSLGLVTGAIVTQENRPHRLGLMRAAAAEVAREAAIEGVPHGKRRWLVDLDPGYAEADLSVHAPDAESLPIDLEISTPTCFYRDRRYFEVPSEWAGVTDARLVVDIDQEEAVREACEHQIEGRGGALIAIPTDELAHRSREPVRAALTAGRLVLGTTDIAKVELSLASQLSTVPGDLVTAIVVDTSRSLSADDRLDARATIRSYLRAAPASRVQVIGFARTATPLLPRWTNATAAAPVIDRVLDATVATNGSSIDAGLREAAAQLATVTGTRRIIVITDERMADALRARITALHQLVATDTLVHVVAIGDDDLTRDDSTALAPLAIARRGLAVRGSANALLLARPIALEHARFVAPGWTAIDPTDPGACGIPGEDALREGRSCAFTGLGGHESGPIAIEGELWREPVRRVIAPDRARALDVAREVSARRFLALSEAEVTKQQLDDAAHALTDGWAMHGEWGGHGGYDGGGGSQSTSTCGDPFATFGHGSGTGTSIPNTVGVQVVAAAASCHVTTAVDLRVESTLDEIVAVDVPAATAAAARTCLEAAIWALPLQSKLPHAITPVRITP